MAPRPIDVWQFRYRGFVIGAWWGPAASDPALRLYREAGFNVVMAGRYMQMDGYGDADRGMRELDMAHRHRLWVMFDTYTMNDRPWGGRRWEEPYDHPTHHPASLAELQWLYERIGRHPALLGFMIGDDQGEVSPRAQACTRFLFEQGKPHLMPWLCGWIPPENLARHNNPICNPQIYPTLYERQLPAEQLALRYVSAYASYSRQCRQYGVLFCPMFNATFPPSERTDSLVRFPAYLALAYGAKGIWYFTYSMDNDTAIQRYGHYQTLEEAKRSLTPLYPVVKEINGRIALWGEKVLGHECARVYCTAFQREQIPADNPPFVRPAEGETVQAMHDDLLAGVLEQKGKPPLVMALDCRASKGWNDLPPREVEIRFAREVTQILVYEGRQPRTLRGNVARLTLQAGGGQLLELRGRV
ncbi:MAG: hypothetical protein HPY54_06365 [Chthonomonadetes bacterium]|nr:hypothetical protein [Chthonomonadetes bacterium]